MRKDKQIIYLLVGVVACEGDVVLFAFQNYEDAVKKLNELDAKEDKFIYCDYEVHSFELMQSSTMN